MDEEEVLCAIACGSGRDLRWPSGEREVPLRFHASIRTHLVALELAVALPLLALLFYSILRDARTSQQKTGDAALGIAQLAAASTEQFLSDARTILNGIAARPLVRQLDPTACDPLFAESSVLPPPYGSLLLVDRDGTSICSQSGVTQGDVLDRQWFQELLRLEEFIVSRPFLQADDRSWQTVLAHPVRDDGGRIAGAVAVAADLAWYQTVLERARYPEGMIAMTDETGTFLARTLEPEKWVGRSGRGVEVVETLLSRTEGQVTARDVDGTKRLYGFTTLTDSGWKIYAGVPVETAFVALRARILRSTLLALLCVLVVLMLALALSRRIERPVLALARATREIRLGDDATRVPVEGPLEIEAVAIGFNQMLDASRDAERRQLRMQEDLRRNEIMSAMGSLVAGVAHEVRNPLFGISATLDAFEARLGGGDEHRQYLVVLRREVNRVNRLMAELLEYGRPKRLDLTRTDPSELVNHAVEDCRRLAEERGVRIRIRIGARLPPIVVDPERMIQVLRNLVENAVQHSSAGGEVTVTAELGGDPLGGFDFIVSDSGPGFAPEDLAYVFEPFFSRRPDGTGLGLAIVRRIVADHGGTVRASNLPGKGGASVVVHLPPSDPEGARPDRGLTQMSSMM